MNNLIDYFDGIYIINLVHRTDRRAEMMAEFKRVGIPLNSEKVIWFDAVRPADAGTFPTLGARGCYLSHMGVMQAARDAGLNRILVLEDDLDFIEDFAQQVPVLLAALTREDWSVMYGTYLLEGHNPGGQPPFVELSSNIGLVNSQFLGFQGDSVKECADYLEAMLARPVGHPDGGPMHVDGAYSWYRRAHPQRRTLIAAPQLGYERPSRTDVHVLKWYDALPVVRTLTQRVRLLRWRFSQRPNV